MWRKRCVLLTPEHQRRYSIGRESWHCVFSVEAPGGYHTSCAADQASGLCDGCLANGTGGGGEPDGLG
jgi:hypothetical protein